MAWKLPEGAAAILHRLNGAGYEAYVVGGCVRDTLLGREPKDFDICTSATPEQMRGALSGLRLVETGLKHGTLTVVIDRTPYEVTTFRVDGGYTDHRHPDGVTFVTDVRADLARRDFTVNAMAYHPETGLVDAFGGQTDLKAGVIRCVGNPSERFEEDALRILRALRFASRYGFAIEQETARAARALRETLRQVAAERVRVELAGILCGQGAEAILMAYPDILSVVLPLITPMVGFQQRSSHHRYDVWEHTARAVGAVVPEEALRLTMLLHDCGKPMHFSVDEKGEGHFYAHAKKSAEMAEAALTALRVDNATFDRVTTLVRHHDMPIEADRVLLKRRLSRFGEETLRALIEVQRADAIATGMTGEAEANRRAQALNEAIDALVAQSPCLTLRALAIGGSELLRLGVPKGPAVGATLNALLSQVINEETPNERAALLAAAARLNGLTLDIHDIMQEYNGKEIQA